MREKDLQENEEIWSGEAIPRQMVWVFSCELSVWQE